MRLVHARVRTDDSPPSLPSRPSLDAAPDPATAGDRDHHGDGASGGGVNLPELAMALAVIGLGLVVAWIGSSYEMGRVARMGPGFFPVALGGLLAVIGAVVALEVWRRETPQPVIRYRPLVLILSGILAFALLVERAGLVPAVTALVVLSALAEPRVRPLTVLGVVVAMSLIGVFLFIKGLAVPLPVVAW